jgi:AraC family transcriptional regulator
MEAGYGSGRLQKFDALVGMIEINPANLESTWHSPDATNYVHIALPPQTLLELAEQEFGSGSIDLQPIPFGIVDQKALHLAQMLTAELAERKAANELYVDSLITLFGIHLLRTYAGSGRAPGRVEGGLPAHKARRVRDFLQENFSRKVSVADVAALCELSPGHFIQAFTSTFGQSPHQYLLQLRVAEAERLLLNGNLPIAEVAYLCGFSSQSHLTSTMRRYKGTTPALIRASR